MNSYFKNLKNVSGWSMYRKSMILGDGCVFLWCGLTVHQTRKCTYRHSWSDIDQRFLSYCKAVMEKKHRLFWSKACAVDECDQITFRLPCSLKYIELIPKMQLQISIENIACGSKKNGGVYKGKQILSLNMFEPTAI